YVLVHRERSHRPVSPQERMVRLVEGVAEHCGRCDVEERVRIEVAFTVHQAPEVTVRSGDDVAVPHIKVDECRSGDGTQQVGVLGDGRPDAHRLGGQRYLPYHGILEQRLDHVGKGIWPRVTVGTRARVAKEGAGHRMQARDGGATLEAYGRSIGAGR